MDDLKKHNLQPKSILSIHNLGLSIKTENGEKQLLRGLDLDVSKGQTLALLGESGSGKTLAAYSILGLLPSVAKITSGTIKFNNADLLKMKQSKLRSIRGNRISMIFQESGTSLNPLMTIGQQIGETLAIHKGLGKKIIHDQVLALMDIVGIADPRRRYRHYPHQLSGGAKQRVVIAMALACRPDLLLADEPTTSLDATVQSQILDLMSRLIRDLHMSVLLITHDLGIIASLADRVAVLHAGQIIEEGGVKEILNSPAHPYTKTLLQIAPSNKSIVKNAHLVDVSSTAHNLAMNQNSCSLASICSDALPRCHQEQPIMKIINSNHKTRCFVPKK